MTNDPTTGIFSANLIASYSIGQRLAWSQVRVANLFPIEADDIQTFDFETEEKIDAWRHRFNSLASMIQDTIFKGIGILEMEDVSGMSKKDMANLMDKLGVIRSSTGFSSLALLRNKLSHHYPDDIEKQAERLNEAWGATPDLLDVLNGVITYVADKHLVEDLQVTPIEIASDAPREPDTSSRPLRR